MRDHRYGWAASTGTMLMVPATDSCSSDVVEGGSAGSAAGEIGRQDFVATIANYYLTLST